MPQIALILRGTDGEASEDDDPITKAERAAAKLKQHREAKARRQQTTCQT